MLVWDAPFYVYIMASEPYGTLYTGQTHELGRRVWEHRFGRIGGFAHKYKVDQLVWFEAWDGRRDAFRRERQIKEWRRAWKIELIQALNPRWEDLGRREEITRCFDEAEARWNLEKMAARLVLE